MESLTIQFREEDLLKLRYLAQDLDRRPEDLARQIILVWLQSETLKEGDIE